MNEISERIQHAVDENKVARMAEIGSMAPLIDAIRSKHFKAPLNGNDPQWRRFRPWLDDIRQRRIDSGMSPAITPSDLYDFTQSDEVARPCTRQERYAALYAKMNYGPEGAWAEVLPRQAEERQLRQIDELSAAEAKRKQLTPAQEEALKDRLRHHFAEAQDRRIGRIIERTVFVKPEHQEELLRTLEECRAAGGKAAEEAEGRVREIMDQAYENACGIQPRLENLTPEQKDQWKQRALEEFEKVAESVPRRSLALSQENFHKVIEDTFTELRLGQPVLHGTVIPLPIEGAPTGMGGEDSGIIEQGGSSVVLRRDASSYSPAVADSGEINFDDLARASPRAAESVVSPAKELPVSTPGAETPPASSAETPVVKPPNAAPPEPVPSSSVELAPATPRRTPAPPTQTVQPVIPEQPPPPSPAPPVELAPAAPRRIPLTVIDAPAPPAQTAPPVMPERAAASLAETRVPGTPDAGPAEIIPAAPPAPPSASPPLAEPVISSTPPPAASSPGYGGGSYGYGGGSAPAVEEMATAERIEQRLEAAAEHGRVARYTLPAIGIAAGGFAAYHLLRDQKRKPASETQPVTFTPGAQTQLGVKMQVSRIPESLLLNPHLLIGK
ncbi:MAG: hypothetical protein JO089_06205 [Alphaproteobacteria bacterium]|nr:hypothetical protein [Alphaproteobacteria bacterium]